MTARTWCFTWNNYNSDSEMRLQNFDFKLLCYGRELSSTGTPHLQGVLVLQSPQRMTYLKSQFGSSPHWEVCRSLPASIAYCKKDGDFFFQDRRLKRGPKPKTGMKQPSQIVDPEKIDEIIEKMIKTTKISFPQ